MTNELRKKIKQFEMKQVIAATFVLVIAVGIAIIVNTIQLNATAKQATSFVTRVIQFEDLRQANVTLNDTRLDGFSRIIFDSDNRTRRFTLPPPLNNNPTSILHRLVTSKITLPADDKLETGYNDRITFEYNDFRLVPYALAVWFLLLLVSIPQTRYMKKKLVEQFDAEMKGIEAQAKADIAREVRHNLRTPLAALMRIPAGLPDSVKSYRDLIQSSVTQMRSIVSALDDNSDDSKREMTKDESPDIYDTIVQALREISAVIPNRIKFSYDIDDAIVSAISPHVPHELRALLGNIVNNSIEAIDGDGEIKVIARDLGPEVQISIEDTGSGINTDVISHIFENGFSSGKKSGSGIGLHHAKTWIEKWGGQITAASKPNHTTTILIRLPIDERASWYIPRLKFSKSDRLVILDDQPSAHSLWKMRLEEAGALKQAQFALTDQDAERLILEAAPSSGNTHYLFDYDIKSNVSGLDLLGRLPNDGRRYLVTGHFDEPEIRNRCDKIGVYLLPKSELARVPIVVV